MSIQDVERRSNCEEEGGRRRRERDTQNQLMNPFLILILSWLKLHSGWVLLNLYVVWKLAIHVSTGLTALGEEGHIKSI